MSKSATEFIGFFANAGASTNGVAKAVAGGKYMATCEGTALDGTHTAAIQAMNSNGDWITVYSFTAGGTTVLDLAPGQYRGVTGASVSAVYLEMASVPAQ